MMRHKHADLIHAWAEGAEIEILSKRDDMWHVIAWPDWDDCCQYRIKPARKPDVVRLAYATTYFGFGDKHALGLDPNLKITFDGETGKLIKAEIL